MDQAVAEESQQQPTNDAEEDVDFVLYGEIGTALAYLKYEPSRYEETLALKSSQIMERFEPYLKDLASPIQTFRSPPMNYRMRCKFGIGVDPHTGQLTYLMWDEVMRPVPIQDFPIASERINQLMPQLLAIIQSSSKLKTGLRAVGFLDTLAGDFVISLFYKAVIDEEWAREAQRLVRNALDIPVVGRSRGVMFRLDRSHVLETLSLKDGRCLKYKQIEGAFSNPNGQMAIHTLNWLSEQADQILKEEGTTTQKEEATDESGALSNPSCDLLEMYCGVGTHTCALSGKFRRVVGVEINRALVEAAKENLALNGIENAHILAIPSEKFRLSLLRTTFPDPTFDFRCVVVDPPKGGLDKYTKSLVAKYDHILYISCNPSSLRRDIEEHLGKAHVILAMAIFDHFPYTTHIEVAVRLGRKR